MLDYLFMYSIQSVLHGLVPGQIDSPYLIIMSGIAMPRDEYYTDEVFCIDNIISYNECIAFPRHGKDGRIKGMCQKATFCFTKLPLEAGIDLSSLV